MAMATTVAGDAVARTVPHPARRALSEADVATFHEHGWLTVKGLLTGLELAELDAHSRALSEGRVDMASVEPGMRTEEDVPESAAAAEENRYFRYIQFHRHLPLHEHYMLHPRILDCLEGLIGPDIMAMQSMLFLKPPNQPGQGYHQDSKYITTSPDMLCGAWIAIDDATEANGCMRFIAASSSEPALRPPDSYTADPAVSALHASGDYSLKLETCLQADADAAAGREVLATAERGDVRPRVRSLPSPPPPLPPSHPCTPFTLLTPSAVVCR
jgi:ectoine hydroxylase-related dioxygenase (phytanoyl-CoA dioxygenase family)